MIAIIQVTLSWLFKNAKGRDDQAFFTTPAFADHKEQTIDITSPDCGPSGGTLTAEYTADGAGKIPTLEWKAPDAIAPQVKEWLLFSEDPGKYPDTIAPYIYSGISPDKTRAEPKDFEVEDETHSQLKGGFYYGKTRRADKMYIPPRPLLNHGPHRYFFEIVALSKPLDRELLKTRPDRHQISEAIKGKILGWGIWIASYERKW